MELKNRQENTCPVGKSYYTCNFGSTTYTGCCSTNACNYHGCPDDTGSITSTTSNSYGDDFGGTPIPIDSSPYPPSPSAKISTTNTRTTVTITTTSDGNVLTTTVSAIASRTRSRNIIPTVSENAQQFNGTDSSSAQSIRTTNSAVIAGVVAGIGGILVAALLIFLWLRFGRKNKTDKDDERTSNNRDANPGTNMIVPGDNEKAETYTNTRHEHKADTVRASTIWSRVSSLTNATGNRAKPRSPVSPMHTPDDVGSYHEDTKAPKHPEMAGSTKDVTAELPDTDFNGRRAELPPNPDRPLINSPNRSPKSPNPSDYAGSSTSGRDTPVMGSNLNGLPPNKATPRTGRPASHVTSFMSYEGDAGPQR